MRSLPWVFSMLPLTFVFGVWGPAQPVAQSRGVTLTGEITNVLLPLATFEAGDTEYRLHLGPIWYWQQENLRLRKGPAQVSGEVVDEYGLRSLYAHWIKQGDTVIVLASEDGIPRWERRAAGSTEDVRGWLGLSRDWRYSGRWERRDGHHYWGWHGHGCP